MSTSFYDEEAALAYEPPEDLPVDVLSVGYGEELATPDPIDTVEAVWSYRGRPGAFTSIITKTGTWDRSLDALLRLTVFEVEKVYATLGGWPEPTPLPADMPEPPPGGVIFE